MRVRIIKDGTRCAGEDYGAGVEIECLPEQGAKLIALGRAMEIGDSGTREATDSDAAGSDDALGPDDDGDAGA